MLVLKTKALGSFCLFPWLLLWRIFFSCPSAVWNESLECDFVLILASSAPGSFLVFFLLHFISQAVCVFGERFTLQVVCCRILWHLVQHRRGTGGGQAGRSEEHWGGSPHCSALGGISSTAASDFSFLTLALQGPASRVQLLTDDSGSGHHLRVAVTSCHLWLLLNLSIVGVTTSLNYTSSLLMLGVNLVLLVRPWLIQLPTSLPLQVKEPPAPMAGWDSLGSIFTLLGRKILPIALDKVTSPKWTTMRQMLSVICLIYVIFWPLRE